jgi:serine/threonine protein phosphatase 1
MRTIAVGDIHGCSTALYSLIEIVKPKADDRLIFLGDYIDRGPDSRGTIDCLLSVRDQCETIFLRGNHEITFLGAYDGRIDIQAWFHIGGETTLVSYGGRFGHIPHRHLDFLRSCSPYYELDSDFFVHANYLPELPLAEQPDRTMYWEHLIDRVPGPHHSGKTAWIGHTPSLRGEIVDLGYLVCIDTFCFGGGYLTAVDIESREVWQVDKFGHLRRHHRPLFQLIKNWWQSRGSRKK